MPPGKAPGYIRFAKSPWFVMLRFKIFTAVEKTAFAMPYSKPFDERSERFFLRRRIWGWDILHVFPILKSERLGKKIRYYA
jgi:hypothetical protein